jgi:hypothetical protein
MKTLKATVLASMILFLLGQTTLGLAGELEGTQMPDQEMIAGKILKLNGMGARKATMFNVLVYVGGLYVENKSTDPAVIMKAPLKAVRMKFRRDVGADKLRDRWKEAFKENCKADCAALDQTIADFFSHVKDAKDGDVIQFVFSGDSVEMKIREEKPVAIKNAAFANLLLSTWIGDHPPSEDFKNGMLGKPQK